MTFRGPHGSEGQPCNNLFWTLDPRCRLPKITRQSNKENENGETMHLLQINKHRPDSTIQNLDLYMQFWIKISTWHQCCHGSPAGPLNFIASMRHSGLWLGTCCAFLGMKLRLLRDGHDFHWKAFIIFFGMIFVSWYDYQGTLIQFRNMFLVGWSKLVILHLISAKLPMPRRQGLGGLKRWFLGSPRDYNT